LFALNFFRMKKIDFLTAVHSAFFTGDIGPKLYDCWQRLSYNMLFIETTLPHSYGWYDRVTGHLTSKLLLAELKTLRRIRRELPQLVVIHNGLLLD
jgi:hypothetical protein